MSAKGFRDFLDARREKKKTEYGLITGLGFYLGIGGLIVVAIAMICLTSISELSDGGSWQAYLFFVRAFGAFVLTLGGILVSVVPADIINIGTMLINETDNSCDCRWLNIISPVKNQEYKNVLLESVFLILSKKLVV